MALAATDAAASGVFRIGGEFPIHRLGYGALRVTGRNNWDEPSDRNAALTLLRRLPGLGITLIDTADSYGPHTSEQLIREALHPYGGVLIATKGGYVRPDPRRWIPCGRPEYLLQSARMSARRLGLDALPLWQLHRIDPTVPRDEQFGAIRQMLDEGLIRHAGLSEVEVEDIQAAEAIFPVATVQNRYNLAERRAEPVLDYCAKRGIGFVPFFPLAAGALASAQDNLKDVANRYQATPPQIALAWLLKRSPVILPIPGASQFAHVEENAAAAGIALTEEDFETLSRISRPSEAR